MNNSNLFIPKGFRFAGVHCGIKPTGNDLSVIIADQAATIAGVYTQNQVHASSIDWNRSITPTPTGRAIVVNSGNANACTGSQGAEDNKAMAQGVAEQLGTAADQVLVLSTGVIGRHMPMRETMDGIKNACQVATNSADDFMQATQGIMTTDRFMKTSSRQFKLGDRDGSIVGMGKGAGMIGPNMATMLCVIATDVYLGPKLADELLRCAVEKSFNRISVEGHTSTNDAVLLISSSGGTVLPNDESSLVAFKQHLTDTCTEIAKMIPTDGEGASHLIEIRVDGAESESDADVIARTIASSALVKTAITGADPNWGRIVSAAGYAGPPINLAQTCLKINEHTVFSNGEPSEIDEKSVSEVMANSETVFIDLTVGAGSGTARHWTSDLTTDYVRLNSEYTT